MAPALAFDEVTSLGTMTVITDASRANEDDGFGGCASVRGVPDSRQLSDRFQIAASGQMRRRKQVPKTSCFVMISIIYASVPS